MKLTLVALTSVFVTGVAHASFDLFLTPGVTTRMSRYDPINLLNLGQFGGSGVTYSHALQVGSQVYLGSVTGRLSIYDYSTGEHILSTVGQTTMTSGMTTGSNPSDALFIGGTFLNRYDLATNSFFFVGALNANIVYSQIARLNSSTILTLGTDLSNQIVIEQRTNSGALIATRTIPVVIENDRIGQVAVLPRNGGGFYVSFVVRATTNRVISQVINSSFGFGGTIENNVSSYTVANSTLPAVVAGHGSSWIVGPDFTSPTTLTRVTQTGFADSAIGFIDSFTYTNNSSFGRNWSMVNIVAPEPATFLALGLPGFLLLRKRRKPCC